MNAFRSSRISRRASLLLCAMSALLAGSHCGSGPAGSATGEDGVGAANAFTVTSDAGTVLRATPLGRFEAPWAMTFLPDGRLLVTEKPGRLLLVGTAGKSSGEEAGDLPIAIVDGVPEISAAGQGGLGDIVLHPAFSDNALVYFSYVERDGSLSGAVVARARFDAGGTPDAAGEVTAPSLENKETIWRQSPMVSGNGHYGHRLAFSPDGYLFISSGERQKFTPAQDLQQNLGKIVRLHDDGNVPTDNPWSSEGGVTAELWSIGHRNPLGLAFDATGQLWEHEMGPRGGDELNRIVRGGNYGYPLVSNGEHYDGEDIPDHDTRPDLQAPATSWSPVISPAGLVVHDGVAWPDWEGSGLIGGLSSTSIVRVSLTEPAEEFERFAMPTRVREVELGNDGVLYALEDREGARLLRLEVEAP